MNDDLLYVRKQLALLTLILTEEQKELVKQMYDRLELGTEIGRLLGIWPGVALGDTEEDTEEEKGIAIAKRRRFKCL